MTAPPHTNRLIHEKSPYLLQHAHNPVDWYPWGDEAFARAAAEDKPIFLSIGYATCHWCHAMERESFEHEEVAALLNRDFIAVKVDREERPDIDDVYMAVCQAVTGSGGWPLTIIMTPDKQPFFAATYLPRETIQGRVGMTDLLPRVAAYWREQRGQALDIAERIREVLQRPTDRTGGGALKGAVRDDAYQELRARYDSRHGGFGQAPKFPAPHNLMLLLRHWRRTGEARALQMVEGTLQALRRGGIYDQVGFGLHRYSTDARWLVPHFEKMLYDQALLVLAAIETYQATGDAQYADLARDTLTYVLRDLTAPEGAFYSAEDADSEGVEGKFYVWTEAEIRATLPPELAELVIRTYNVTADGNFHDEASGEATGANILHLTELVPAEAGQWAEARALLLAHRSQRVRPLLDDKVLTDWNGLMIAACARAAWVLDDAAYLEASRRAAGFVLTRLRDGAGGLLHRFRDDDAAIPAFLDDYAFLAWGLLELYQAGFDPAHLAQAQALVDHALAHFRDAGGGFASTADYHEHLLTRRLEAYDAAVPSGNSVMLSNLVRLSRLLGMPEYEQAAADLAQAFAYEVGQAPAAHTAFLCGLDLALADGQEILIAGGTDVARAAFLDALRPVFLPHAVTLVLTPDTAPALRTLAPWLEAFPADAAPAAAYVCVGRACRAPVSTPAELLAQLSP